MSTAGTARGDGAAVFREPRWPASIALLVGMGLYLSLPGRLTLGPSWIIPALEFVLVVPLTLFNPYRESGEAPRVRIVAVGVIALMSLANLGSVILLVQHLLAGENITGKSLIYSAVSIWATNIIVFGLWFWELDRGGPARRGTADERHADFQFPQMLASDPASRRWLPSIVDYLYVGFTNATAFSPTDAMPLSAAAKSLMTAEALISLTTVVVIAGRAVNILK